MSSTYSSFIVPTVALQAMFVAAPADCGTLVFDGFADASLLTLNGDAATVETIDGTVLRLATATTFSSGSAFSSATVDAAQFSTKFVFRITESGGVTDCEGQSGADGLVFVAQSVSSSIGGAGGGLGYQGIANSVGVEFDTYCNSEFNDPGTNHVAVNLDGSVAHELSGEFTAEILPLFDDGELRYVWVDYDGTTVRVYVNEVDVQPFQPVVSRDVDLPTILGQNTAFVGFTAGTGSAVGNHDIIYWEYTLFAPVCIGDFDGDGVVDGADLGTLLANWDSDLALFDLNGDDVVDGIDIGLLLAQWGVCPG
jgi:hypothetical protein